MAPQRVPEMFDPRVFSAAQEVIRQEPLARDVEVVDARARVTDAT
ncbi:hypothetical protein [Streptomyces mirabilis]|uniref:Uncharacterized protein n=1 Tax=Streptomyces mirabilis TaxID=68239 RepID=A0ABU3V5C1_9ACTN|nr:hypothetical protein [Streptomyces mirabilis]MCX5355726.1 hypothetical protein [Streptomyces mirabilis]MDU9001369.1 hypothetical protein [Streptomyces mirabilis]